MDVSERNCNDIIYISLKLLIFESIGERMMEEEIRSERVWNVVKIFVTFYLYAAGLRTRCEEKGNKEEENKTVELKKTDSSEKNHSGGKFIFSNLKR